jgi:hypothetical protein
MRKAEEKLIFRNVAVPMEDYELLDQLAKKDQRSKARQLSVMIRRAYEQEFSEN